MKRLALLLIATACLPSPTFAGDDGAPADGDAVIQLAKDLELKVSLDTIAKTTKRPVLYDPNSQRIRGQKIGVTFEFKVPSSRLFDAYRAILTAYELTLIPVGPSGYEIYLAVDSRSTNNFIKNKAQFISADQVAEYRDRDGLFVAAFFPLANVKNMTTVRTALSTMVTPAGIGRVQEVPENGIIVMDFAPVVYTMSQVIQRLDKPSPSAQVLESIELEYGKAAEVAEAVQALWIETVATAPKPTRRGIRAPGPPPRIVPYAARNAIVVRASRAELEMIRGLVKKLDQPTGKTNLVEVIRLAHVRAQPLANTLNATLTAPTVLGPQANIVADPQSNSLVIVADRRSLAGIKDIVAALDAAPHRPEDK